MLKDNELSKFKFYWLLAIQMNEVPAVIKTAPSHVRLPMYLFSIIIDVTEVMSKVKELVKRTQTDSELDFLCSA